jgi:hypothetical protein
VLVSVLKKPICHRRAYVEPQLQLRIAAYVEPQLRIAELPSLARELLPRDPLACVLHHLTWTEACGVFCWNASNALRIAELASLARELLPRASLACVQHQLSWTEACV